MTQTQQAHFLEQAQHMAFYGLSGSGKGYAYDALKAVQMARPDLHITPVHPSSTALAGLRAWASAARLVPPPDCAMIVLKPQDAAVALEDAAAAGAKSVWLVQNAASRANLARAAELGLKTAGGCPVLFVPGQPFPHSFHRALAQMFGKL
jgi:uncharacterized protein